MTDYGYVDVGKLADFANNTIGGLTANDIMRFPRVDVQPVKHGKWIAENQDKRGYADCFTCSNCNNYTYTYTLMKVCEHDYCPNCGARMDGDTNE